MVRMVGGCLRSSSRPHKVNSALWIHPLLVAALVLSALSTTASAPALHSGPAATGGGALSGPLRRSLSSSIRIRFDTNELASEQDAESFERFNELLTSAADLLEQTVRVVQNRGHLMVSRTCTRTWDSGRMAGHCAEKAAQESCGPVDAVPESHLGGIIEWHFKGGDSYEKQITAPGDGVVDADLLIYVTHRPEDTGCQSAGRFNFQSGVCRRDQRDRPVAGYMNVCHKDATYSGDDLRAELLRILAFSDESFAYFVDSFGSPRTPRCPAAAGCSGADSAHQPPKGPGNSYFISPTTVAVSSERGEQVRRIVTPAVAAAARKQFGCGSLSGAELEGWRAYEAGAPTRWEKRIFGNELLSGKELSRLGDSLVDGLETSERFKSQVLSSVSLALLEDSGWYEVDYQKSEVLSWGFGRGCAFVSQKCLSKQNELGWCGLGVVTAAVGCSEEEPASLGRCTLADLPSQALPQYWYFGDQGLGGLDPEMDFCPFYKRTELLSCKKSVGKEGLSLEAKGSVFGDDSICAKSSLQAQSISHSATAGSQSAAGCYIHRCTQEADRTLLEIKGPDGTWRPCSQDFHELTGFQGYNGSLICPAIAAICGSPSLLNASNNSLKHVGLDRMPFRLVVDVSMDTATGRLWREALLQAVAYSLQVSQSVLSFEATCKADCESSSLQTCAAEDCQAATTSRRTHHTTSLHDVPPINSKLVIGNRDRHTRDADVKVVLRMALSTKNNQEAILVAEKILAKDFKTKVISQMKMLGSGVSLVEVLQEKWMVSPADPWESMALVSQAESSAERLKMLAIGVAVGLGVGLLCNSLCYWQRQTVTVKLNRMTYVICGSESPKNKITESQPAEKRPNLREQKRSVSLVPRNSVISFSGPRSSLADSTITTVTLSSEVAFSTSFKRGLEIEKAISGEQGSINSARRKSSLKSPRRHSVATESPRTRREGYMSRSAKFEFQDMQSRQAWVPEETGQKDVVASTQNAAVQIEWITGLGNVAQQAMTASQKYVKSLQHYSGPEDGNEVAVRSTRTATTPEPRDSRYPAELQTLVKRKTVSLLHPPGTMASSAEKQGQLERKVPLSQKRQELKNSIESKDAFRKAQGREYDSLGSESQVNSHRSKKNPIGRTDSEADLESKKKGRKMLRIVPTVTSSLGIEIESPHRTDINASSIRVSPVSHFDLQQ